MTDPVAAAPKLESPFNRFVGAAIDDALWFALFVYIVGWLPASVWDDHPEVIVILLIATCSAWLNYFSICETKWGYTLGKKVMGMRVVAQDGSKATFGACSIRNLLRPVDYLLIGPLMISSTARNQRLGDKLGKTIVIAERKPRRPAAAPGGAAAAAMQPSADDTPLTDRQHKPLPERRMQASAPPMAGPAIEQKPTNSDASMTLPPWSVRQTWWGVGIGLLLALFVPLIFVAPFDPDLSSLGATLAAQALLTVALVGTAIYVARGAVRNWRQIDLRAALTALGWRKFKGTDLLLAIGALFSYYLCAAVYVVIFGSPHQEDIADQLGLDRGPFLAGLAVLLICVVAPMAEETFFRGMAFAGLRGRLRRLPAALISGAIFGAVHAPSGPSAVVPLAIFGTVLALLFEQTDSIVPGVFAHVINNSIAIAAA
jgi:CAAX protease family protein